MDDDDIPARISLTLSGTSAQGTSRTYVSRIEVSAWEDTCILECSDSDVVASFTVNGYDMMQHFPKRPPAAVQGSLIPAVNFFELRQQDLRLNILNVILANRLVNLAHNRTGYTKILAFSRILQYREHETMLGTLRAFNLRHWPYPTKGDMHYGEVRALTFAKDIPSILRAAQRAMTRFAEGITYLGPFRQAPERFHRQQELSVSQIDPQGKNLAMFLRSLDPRAREELSDFVHQYLGIKVRAEDDGSHVSVVIEDGSSRKHNLIDMGYGLSQVLPVLAMCWTISKGGLASGRLPRASVLAMEQPELHLHPRHQAKLADMLVAVIESARAREPGSDREPAWLEFDDPAPKFPLSIVVETHSEALINRLGELIELNELSPQDVTVLLFERNEENGVTSIRESSFSGDGQLQNWPFGFFAA